MTDLEKWQARRNLKLHMLKYGQNELSGEALNLMAGLPANAVMPPEMFGLLGNAHDLA